MDKPDGPAVVASSVSPEAFGPLRPEGKAPTHAERAAKGREARDRVARRSHGEWEPSPDRRDPIEIPQEQAKSRVPELVPTSSGLSKRGVGPTRRGRAG